MLRRLDFTPGAPLYELMQQALYVTQAKFSMGELPTLADVQKKFDAIGVPMPKEKQFPGGIITLRVCIGGAVVLEEAEYNALVKAYDDAGWLPAVAQAASDGKRLLTGLTEWKPPLELVREPEGAA